MVEIVFLGTGGGRKNLIQQVRRTAGFRINGSLSIHVDPGPGVLAACKQFGLPPSEVELVVVTHDHIDHMNDAGLLIEAMAEGRWKAKVKGMLIGSKSCIAGGENGERAISSYHQKMMEKTAAATQGKRMGISVHGKKAVLLPTKVKHEDETGFGFVLEMDGVRIGYTSDTEYFEGISKQYAGCDLLIANCLKPKEDGLPGHLYNEVTAKLFREAKPKLAVITHLGMVMLHAGPEKEAAKIEKMGGVKTIAAVDGMKITLAKVNAAGLKIS